METTTQVTDLATRIHAARVEAGMNKSELARAMGTTHVTVGNWESGAHEIKLIDALRFCSVTGQSLDWLAYGLGEMRKAPAANSEGLAARPEGFEPPTF
ncbi:MAG: helix-turn-helix transcriptional regulator [Leucobacter sp.]